MAKSLEFYLSPGQLAGKCGRLTASLRAFEDDGRREWLLVGIEKRDHELIVRLSDTAKLALWSEGAKVNVCGHRARMKALAKVAARSLHALARGVSKAHFLSGSSVAKSHFVCSFSGVRVSVTSKQ
jgi:hypothetical protein